jgi:hypothetical protein
MRQLITWITQVNTRVSTCVLINNFKAGCVIKVKVKVSQFKAHHYSTKVESKARADPLTPVETGTNVPTPERMTDLVSPEHVV